MCKLFALDRNTGNHTTVRKLFVLDRNTYEGHHLDFFNKPREPVEVGTALHAKLLPVPDQLAFKRQLDTYIYP